MRGLLPATVIVIAKAPVPGRVKTRLTPPFTPEQAARLAGAALSDTLDVVTATPVTRRVLALDGPSGPWIPNDYDIISQRGDGLDERLAAAFADCYGLASQPMVLIGMDTPQVTPALREEAAMPLVTGDADAVLGLASDGGFWLLGLRQPDWSLLRGVPMSRPDTGQMQFSRLMDAELRVAMVRELTDVDSAQDATRVAAQIPGSRFAATLAWEARRLEAGALELA